MGTSIQLDSSSSANGTMNTHATADAAALSATHPNYFLNRGFKDVSRCNDGDVTSMTLSSQKNGCLWSAVGAEGMLSLCLGAP